MKTTRKSGPGPARSGRSSPRKAARDGLEVRDEKRSRHLAGIDIDFKNGELLKKFMTEQGKIIPRRVTGTSSKQQRKLKKAIRQARTIGLVR